MDSSSDDSSLSSKRATFEYWGTIADMDTPACTLRINEAAFVLSPVLMSNVIRHFCVGDLVRVEYRAGEHDARMVKCVVMGRKALA